MKISTKIMLSLFTLALLLNAVSVMAADKPAYIRIGIPSSSYNKPLASGPLGEIQVKELFEEEFKKDGIRLDVQYFQAAGPAVNEALSNDNLDFGSIGDLPAVAGFAAGLKTRAVAATRAGNTYVVVPSDSLIRSVKDLKGKKIGISLGTYMHAAALKILKDNGLSENDVTFFNMDSTTLVTAVAGKQVEAGFMTSDAITLRTRGVARIVYSTAGKNVFYQNAGALLVRDEFARKYPDLTRRFVKVWVKASYLHSKNKLESQKLDTRVGTPLSTVREDQAGQPIVYLNSPKFDEMWLAHDRRSIALFKQHGLIRRTFDPDKVWIDRSFLNAALKELNLEHFWPDYDINGNPKK
jgi:sulfonate transport system substrate-binding protein